MQQILFEHLLVSFGALKMFHFIVSLGTGSISLKHMQGRIFVTVTVLIHMLKEKSISTNRKSYVRSETQYFALSQVY